VAYDLSAYRGSFATTGTPGRTGLDEDQLVWVTKRALDYATGRRADLQFDRAELDGGPPGRPAFTARETEHMIDVRELFARAAGWRLAALGVAAAAAVALVALEGRRAGTRRLARGLVFASVLSMLVWAGLAVPMVSSFTAFWDSFHLSLFDNDLWQLPRGSLLIEMLPESLFQRLALEVAGLFTAEVLLILVLLALYLRRASAGNRR
jgi:integral membrane protein (TIGR01906 family)